MIYLLGCSLELTVQKQWNQLKSFKSEMAVPTMPLEQGVVGV